MNFTFDKTGKIIINVSKDEVSQINEVTRRLTYELNGFIENEREDLYFEVSTFITNDAIKSKLSNLKYHIINDLNYNTAFKNVVHYKNGRVEFVKNDDLYQFASAYQIISDTSSAQRVLKNILRVQLIDWLIENDFKQDNSKDFIYNIPKNLTTQKNSNFRGDIFKSPGLEDLFYFILNNTCEINSRKNVGAFYHWFYPSLSLECTRYDFALFWNELKHAYKIPIYKNSKTGISNEPTEKIIDILNELKQDFDSINTST